MPLLNNKATAGTPSLPQAGDVLDTHSEFLRQIKESLEIGERRTGDILDSYITVQDMLDLGYLIEQGGRLSSVERPILSIRDGWDNDKSGGSALDPTKEVTLNHVVPYDATLLGVALTTRDASGSCEVDIWKDTFQNYPPTVADTIVGSNKPEIITGVIYVDLVLDGWATKQVNAGDVIAFKLETCTTFHGIIVDLFMRPTLVD